MSTGIWATEICPEDNASISEGLAWKHRMSEVHRLQSRRNLSEPTRVTSRLESSEAW